MLYVLVCVDGLKTPHLLLANLAAVDIALRATVRDRVKLLQEVVRHAPDMLICDAPAPDNASFKTTQAIVEMAHCAVVGFFLDADVGRMERAKVLLMHTQHLPDDAAF